MALRYSDAMPEFPSLAAESRCHLECTFGISLGHGTQSKAEAQVQSIHEIADAEVVQIWFLPSSLVQVPPDSCEKELRKNTYEFLH